MATFANTTGAEDSLIDGIVEQVSSYQGQALIDLVTGLDNQIKELEDKLSTAEERCGRVESALETSQETVSDLEDQLNAANNTINGFDEEQDE